jgi:metal-responsive CopG/Arc/MetJ family transcriptional regulator
MPVLAPSNTVYPSPVAKVMISLPDELLKQVDRLASERGLSRSGFLQALAELELGMTEERRRDEIRRLLELATGDYGGDATKLIREDRDSR